MAAHKPNITRLEWHPDIVTLERLAQLLPWPEATLKSCFNGDYENYASWSSEDDLIGFALVHTASDWWTIMNIVTKPTRQRQGVARQLLQHIQQCAEGQQRAIVLEVRQSNHGAQQLYQSCGFVLEGRRKEYYATTELQREDALVMRWSRV